MHNETREKQREKTIAQAKLTLLKESVEWKNAFGTEDGQKCLALLKKCYYDINMISANDSIVTQNRAAQRDLVRYIMTQLEYTGE